MKKLDSISLRELGNIEKLASCSCALRPTAAWESFTEDRWSAEKMVALGTLRDMAVYEPTHEEHHPEGTRYASPNAPVAVDFFPYNVCDVYSCVACHQVVLRYTEFGGYYVDHRVRALDPSLVAEPLGLDSAKPTG